MCNWKYLRYKQSHIKFYLLFVPLLKGPLRRQFIEISYVELLYTILMDVAPYAEMYLGML